MTRQPTILVMAKAPMAGQVKTRLTALLGPTGCAELQARLLVGTVAVARQVAPTSTFLAVEPPGKIAGLRALVGPQVHLLAQHGEDLGQRMARAVEQVLRASSGPILVIGTDAPTLTPRLLADAAKLLAEGYDAVFGPALDGGYYLAGLVRSEPAVFDIDPGLWGGPRVLAASLAAAQRLGWRVALLPTLIDLDTPGDARKLRADPLLPRMISDLLAEGTPR